MIAWGQQWFSRSKRRATLLAGLLAGVGFFSAAMLGGQIQDPFADAVRNFELGRYDRASRTLEDILRTEPECGECYDLLARIATTQGADSLAAAWYRRALEIEPGNAVLYQKLGFAEHRAGNLERAILALEHSLELNPANAEAHFTIGNIWYDLDTLQLAKSGYLKALALDSTAASYHFQLGLVYFKTDVLDSALVEFQTTYRLYPKYSLAYEFAANILITQGRWPEVVEVLERGLDSAPETPVTRYWLGRAHLRTGHFTRAADLLRSYVDDHQDHLGARYNYGLALYEIEEFEEAATQLCSVTVHLPELLRGWLYYGRSLSALDRDSLAFAALDTLLSKDPSNYEGWISRGDIDLKRDRYGRALEQYRHAAGLNPDGWEAYHRQGLTHYFQGQYPLAEQFVFEALIRQDSVATIYDIMGDVSSVMGEDDFSVYYYAMVLRLEPKNAAVRMKLVDAFVRRRLWRPAMDQLLWFHELNPADEKVLYQLGRLAFAYGDTMQAHDYMSLFQERHNRRMQREKLELRIRFDRRNPRHYRELAWHYRELEDNARARAYFRRAVALGDTTLPASLYMDEGVQP